MKGNWFIDRVRDLIMLLDRAVYETIKIVYNLILDLANATIISNSSVQELYRRVYTLLGLFMLFRVTFSAINYIIHPEQLTDKSKGIQNIVKNVLIVLVVLIITPTAFEKLYQLQGAILNDELVPRLILSSSENTKTQCKYKYCFQMTESCIKEKGYAQAASQADYIALMVFRPFYQPDDSLSSPGLPESYCKADGTVVKMSSYSKGSIYNKKQSKIYIIDYKILLSTAVGVVTLLILVNFAFDIAVRSIKLVFLQIIAPVPIISYINPGQNGGSFIKWLQEVGKAWLSIFLKLGALFLGIFVISKVDQITHMNAENGGQFSSSIFWIQLFVILGALMFAKKMIPLIETIFNVHLDDKLELNPFKKVSSQAFLGDKVAAGAIGLGSMAVGGALGLVSNAASWSQRQANLEKEKKKEKELKKEADKHRLAAKKAKLQGNNYEARDEERRAKSIEQDIKRTNRRLNPTMSKLRFAGTVSGGILSGGFRSLKGAVGAKTDKVTDVIKQGVAGATASSQKRTLNDTYTRRDRVRDKFTDIANIKNTSGTASLTAGTIKEKTAKLNAAEASLSRLNNTLSMMQSESTNDLGEILKLMRIITDDKGKQTYNEFMNFPDSKEAYDHYRNTTDQPIAQEKFNNLYAGYRESVDLSQTIYDLKKEISGLQDISDLAKRKDK